MLVSKLIFVRSNRIDVFAFFLSRGLPGGLPPSETQVFFPASRLSTVGDKAVNFFWGGGRSRYSRTTMANPPPSLRCSVIWPCVSGMPLSLSHRPDADWLPTRIQNRQRNTRPLILRTAGPSITSMVSRLPSQKHIDRIAGRDIIKERFSSSSSLSFVPGAWLGFAAHTGHHSKWNWLI